jgi:hypothetical protein
MLTYTKYDRTVLGALIATEVAAIVTYLGAYYNLGLSHAIRQAMLLETIGNLVASMGLAFALCMLGFQKWFLETKGEPAGKCDKCNQVVYVNDGSNA